MTLKELGAEYIQGADALRDRVRELRRYLPTMRGKARKELEARIRALYASAGDAREVGKYLIGYYSLSEKTDSGKESGK